MVADDDRKNVGSICEHLINEGYSVLPCYGGGDTLEFFYRNIKGVDLIIIDIYAGGVGGLDALKKIRDVSGVPVVVLTARSEEADQLAGFARGADDYVTKPYSVKVLTARVKNILRRGEAPEETIDYGLWQFCPQACQIIVNNTKIHLTLRENSLLVYLAHNTGTTLSRERLLNAVWDIGFDGGERTVDTHIKQLRAKINTGEVIQTVRGYGYRFAIEPVNR